MLVRDSYAPNKILGRVSLSPGSRPLSTQRGYTHYRSTHEEERCHTGGSSTAEASQRPSRGGVCTVLLIVILLLVLEDSSPTVLLPAVAQCRSLMGQSKTF
eukprot:946297-Rhodomonas_salina.1